jgi:peptidoglycan/xylan/chitin deacetylase (PgdA/CDA1 family)
VASALIGVERVRLASREAFQPRRHRDLTPDNLERFIVALRRWRIDIVSIDEALARLADRSAKPFVSLSVDGAYRDALTAAHPVFAKHHVPFTVYVPSGFPDGIAQPWWSALEVIIRQNLRISLVKKGKQTFFTVPDAAAKLQLYQRLTEWMRGLPPQDLSAAMADLCTRYGVDLADPARDGVMDWQGISTLGKDPLVTIGCATVTYPVLTQLSAGEARREIAMGRAVVESAMQRPVLHFAYPFGDASSFTDRHADMVRDSGMLSAVTNYSGTIKPTTADLFALPRLMWGNKDALRHLRVRLAGY